MIDYQKSKVYAWEDEVIRPRSHKYILYDNAQAFVDGVFLTEGWLYPPKILPLPIQKTSAIADGSREEIRLRSEGCFSWVLIHEMCHSLTSDINQSNQHSVDFLGIYIMMLTKYCDVPLPLLLYTATKAGLKFNLSSQPWFNIEKEIKYA